MLKEKTIEELLAELMHMKTSHGQKKLRALLKMKKAKSCYSHRAL